MTVTQRIAFVDGGLKAEMVASSYREACRTEWKDATRKRRWRGHWIATTGFMAGYAGRLIGPLRKK